MKILFTPKGRRRELAVSRWWRENGSQPDLFDREMLAALERLKKSPSSGTLYATLDGSDVRRVLLKRSKQYVYYRVVEDEDVVAILLVWGTKRGKPPL